MKLNRKQTVSIGFAFLTTMMLWQVYNWMVPLYLNGFLSSVFRGDKFVVGIVMALDNLFAIFMIPLVSNLSDKTHTKIGRRTPYIFVGILLSAVTFVLLPLSKRSGNIVLLLANILFVLIFMNIYRSPCVSLMPDVTPKPFRSRANSIMNIMGGVGVAIGYICIVVLAPISDFLPFVVVSLIMLICLAIFLFATNEPKMVANYNQTLKDYKDKLAEEHDEEKQYDFDDNVKTDKLSIVLTLFTVLFIYMAINAVETFMSLYSESVFLDGGNLKLAIDPGALVMIPFGVGSFIFAVVAAQLAGKFGRRNVVLLGEVIMLACYIGVGIFGMFTGFTYWLLLLFFICGCGFSLIIINIYPMVIKYCTADNVGKYTGFYYTASMLGQSITPALCGYVLSGLGFGTMRALFPYSAVFLVLAICSTMFIKTTKSEKASMEKARNVEIKVA